MSLEQTGQSPPAEERARALLGQMSLDEKIGQMSQVNGDFHELHQSIREGRIGSVLNQVDVDQVNELQRIALHESRLGIPLLIGRDVIHGFKTIFPIPLAQAASWNPELVREAARIAAVEAASAGVNWTFAPMIDIARDPRWGRIAESLGEDPYLCSTLGAAMVEGFQGDNPGVGTVAACAKHFAGYGAVEGGLDYNTANIPENELRNVYLRPFKAAVDAGVLTFMAAFNDLNGVPASGNAFLMKQILRNEWGFDGFVVSDWDSVHQLTVHGFTDGDREAALAAASAGVDMEMASRTYADHLPSLVEAGAIDEQAIDAMAYNILLAKFRLGLFDNPFTDTAALPRPLNSDHLRMARQAAVESCVLLKNENGALPLDRRQISSLAVIGSLADDGYEQLGTWVFDGESRHSRTCLQAFYDLTGEDVEVRWSAGLAHPRLQDDEEGFVEAVRLASESDAVIMVMGEESILSGEAHCRADISLPGGQEALIDAVSATGKPVILVVMAGRPLTLGAIIDKVDAVLYAWHPGTMGGPAIADLLFGVEVPSGKLPVTFPLHVGQIPMYYARKNTGRPPEDEQITHIDDIDGRAPQTSLGMSAFYLDAGFRPAYPFGYGLSYTRFEYSDIAASAGRVAVGETIEISATLRNCGERDGTEIAQLYVRDLVGSVTRPVRELKGFQRLHLAAGESRRISFQLDSDDLMFFGRNMKPTVEPGGFQVWIGGDSTAELCTWFELVEAEL